MDSQPLSLRLPAEQGGMEEWQRSRAALRLARRLARWPWHWGCAGLMLAAVLLLF